MYWTKRGIGASLRWSVVTARHCGAPSSQQDAASQQQDAVATSTTLLPATHLNFSRCPSRFRSVNCTPSVQLHVMAIEAIEDGERDLRAVARSPLQVKVTVTLC